VFSCAPSPGALAAQARKIAGLISPAIIAITGALAGADVAHFHETGFRVAGKLAWVRSVSAGKFVLVTVQPKRGKQGMDGAGVLPAFAGIACHDAWKPYDGVAGHALCGAQLLRELIAVTETGIEDDVIWAQQATDALLALKEAADATRDAGHHAIDAEIALSIHPNRHRLLVARIWGRCYGEIGWAGGRQGVPSMSWCRTSRAFLSARGGGSGRSR
jgi:hypothetical protein